MKRKLGVIVRRNEIRVEFLLEVLLDVVEVVVCVLVGDVRDACDVC